MKRLLLGATIFSGAVLLGGCPIYSTSSDTRPYGSFGGGSGSGGTVPISSGPDAGDCSGGCRGGYTCKLSGGRTQCVPNATSQDGGGSVDASTFDSGPGDATSSTSADAHADGPNASDAVYVSDVVAVLDGSDASRLSDGAGVLDSPATGSCNASSACSGTERCIDGMCTPQSQLCSDTTQCIASGEACVDGVCEPHCDTAAPCPAGYGCDFTRRVCNVNPHPCTGSGTLNCQGGSTCVEGRCVAPCVAQSAGGACPSGEVCVNGGCIPDEAAQFACRNDGQSGQLATTCSTTEICLHHDCYAACDPDAGAAACSDPAATCKLVTVSEGTYLVCATTSNLGSDCDLAVGTSCASGVCIDGYCR
jgi:hypothetical protein